MATISEDGGLRRGGRPSCRLRPLPLALLLMLAFAEASALVMSCPKSMSSSLRNELAEEPNVSPLVIEARLEELSSSADLKQLLDSEVKAVLLFEPDDLAHNDETILRLLYAGHYISVNTLLRRSDRLGTPREELETVRSLTQEIGFLESIGGKRSLLVIAPVGQVSTSLSSSIAALSQFYGQWGALSLAEGLEALKSGAVASVERFFDTDQLHCAYDRLSCDFVGRWEMYRRQCQQLRVEYYAREDVDLFKFVRRSAAHLDVDAFREAALHSESINLPEGQSFLALNKERVERAADRIRAGSHLKDVMLVLFSLSDDELRRGNIPSILEYELRGGIVQVLRVVRNVAVVALLLALAAQIRVMLRRDDLGRNLGDAKAPLLHRLAGFSKAD